MSRIGKDEAKPAAEQSSENGSLWAKHVKVYPKAVQGPVRQVKWGILIFCLTVYYVLPWVRWNRGPGQPNQAVLLDTWNERFYFFNMELWPQDIWLLAGLLIAGAIALFLVTSLAGRLWCGYACPQTVWTDLYMLAERWIEGDRNERMKRDAGPLTADRARRVALKHAVWLAIAFWTGGAGIMYFVDAPTLTVEFWTGQASTAAYFFIGLFTFTTYLLAGTAREQVCVYMCPWPRFQSAMLDDQSFTVTYQAWRGEPRTRGKRIAGEPSGGDCVDCGLCVAVCPTGIDIRDGIQLQCISCALCVDACNTVMTRLNRPKWLINWDTEARHEAKLAGRHEPIKFIRARSVIYMTVLLIILAGLTYALANRSTVNLSVQRDRAPVFVPLSDGSLRNGYTLKIANKTQAGSAFDLQIQGLPGAVLAVAEDTQAPGATVHLPAAKDEVGTYRILVVARPASIPDGMIPIDFVLRNAQTGQQTVYHSSFMGPRDYAAGR